MATIDPNQDIPPSGATPWWEGPPPAGWTGPWPPPLQEGDSYGPEVGQVNYTPEHAAALGLTTPPPKPEDPGPNPTPGPTGGPTPSPTPGPSPVFTPPPYTPPPAFSYADFVAPDPGDLDKDPAHAYTLRSQQNAIQHSAAARGVLNTGGTVNDLLMNARDINSTDYSNLFNRKMSTYAANRGNALDTYNTNYGTQVKDPYQISYMGAQDAYNATQHNFDMGTQYNWYRTLFDFQKDQDAWQRRYQLLNFA